MRGEKFQTELKKIYIWSCMLLAVGLMLAIKVGINWKAVKSTYSRRWVPFHLTSVPSRPRSCPGRNSCRRTFYQRIRGTASTGPNHRSFYHCWLRSKLMMCNFHREFLWEARRRCTTGPVRADEGSINKVASWLPVRAVKESS